MPKEFELIDANFGADVNSEIETYLDRTIEAYEKEHTDLHLTRIPRWRKNYLGVPAQDTKNFPWPNASNVIVQVIGSTVDTLAARVLGLLYATHPLWVFQNFNKSTNKEVAEARRRVLEDFMDLVGYEPDQLNLLEIEALWFTDTARLGTAFVKLLIEDVQEVVKVGYDSAAKKKTGEMKTIYEGPRVVNLRHEDVLMDIKAPRPSASRLVVHRRSLSRWDLEDRAMTGAYDQAKVDEILRSPDRPTPREPEKQELQDQGLTPTSYDVNAEWDIYECYLPWWVGKKKYRIIVSYHKRTKTVLRQVFNFLPNNELPILRSKLGYRTDGAYGHGYAELLERYQEEASSMHNQRNDNATMANIRALRISPRVRNLDMNFELYPGALLVGEKDDIEAIQVGDVYPSAFQAESVVMGLVQERAGISPAQSGYGTGGMQKRPAVYSAMGTMAVMQENNSRVGHATSEFRHAHVMLGSLLTAMYAQFGVGDRDKAFGLDAKMLNEALAEIEAGRMRIPIRAATGSLNKEIEKQNDMLMVGLVQRFYTAIGQLIQAASNPVIPQPAMKYFIETAQAHTRLMKRVLKDFGYDQPDEFIPEPPFGQNKGTGGGGEMAPTGPSMAGVVPPPSSGSGGVSAVPGVPGATPGPPTSPEPTVRPI